jgi:hypothetical protein
MEEASWRRHEPERQQQNNNEQAEPKQVGGSLCTPRDVMESATIASERKSI